MGESLLTVSLECEVKYQAGTLASVSHSST